VTLLDLLLARFQWYRRWVGGRWECIRELAITNGATFWARCDLPTPRNRLGVSEHVLEREDWRR
jgi:hypothetical protein